MARESYNDLLAFVVVARERSFTRAAAYLGVSPSALSHTVRALEARLGVRLLVRTTRSVAPSEAGERLFATVAPRFAEIDTELAAVREWSNTPAGTVRLTATEHAATHILWPRLSAALAAYPEIRLEISVDHALADLVAGRFDAGVRLGHQVARDMVSVPIGGPQRVAVVATPAYFERHGRPATPHDLLRHDCLNLRLPTHGGLLPWDFEKNGAEVRLRVAGRWTFNSGALIVRAALAGRGLAYAPEDMVAEPLGGGRLARVLDDWCAPYAGYHLYYPSRRQASRALDVVVEALRHRPGATAAPPRVS